VLILVSLGELVSDEPKCPDAATGTITATTAVNVTVTAPAANPAFALTNSGNLTLLPGATTGNTSAITATPSGGFTAAVSLSCAVTTSIASPNDPPTCSLPSSVSITGASAATATLTVNSTAATAASLTRPLRGIWGSGSGAVLAIALFFGIPRRRRRWSQLAGLLAVVALGSVMGCGGGAPSGNSNPGNAGTTAGTYVVTISGTSAGIAKQTTTVACQRANRVAISGINLWKETRLFPAGSLAPICGIGLVECSQEIFTPIPLPKLLNPSSVHSYPVHVLSINDFLNLAMLLGSIWDVFNYFKQRATVAHLLPGLNLERPLVSYYTLKSRQDFSGFRVKDANELAELHQLFLLDNLPEFGERDRLAGYVNAVVHQLHTRHQDFEQYVPEEFQNMVEPAESRKAYLGMAGRLNALPMSNKAWIGREIETCIAKVRRAKRSRCFLYKQLRGELVFVFAVFSGWSRTDKLRALWKFLSPAQHCTGMSEALGVAYDADDDNMGFDLLWRRGPIENPAAAAALATELFPGELYTQCPTPFGHPRLYTPQGYPS
jgi:hypothetical protein